jgi:hypothetical protein
MRRIKMSPFRLSMFVILAVVPAAAHAGMMIMLSSIPTLGEWGLIGLSAGVGSVGAWLVARKK